MKRKTTSTPATARTGCLLGLLSLLAFSPAASGAITVFGSANDGYGGFTTGASTIVPTPAPAWSLETNAARFTNNPDTDSGQVNSSLLRQYSLDRNDGKSYTMTGIVQWTSTYAGDNNRLAISLFRTSELEASFDTGLTLLANVGAASNQLQIRTGYNGAAASQATLSGVTREQLIGQTLTYLAQITFVGSNIEIDFTLSAPLLSYSQKISATVAASSFAGEYFGFSARGRVRKTTPGVNDIPFMYDAKSFSVVDLDVPPTVIITPNANTAGNYDFTWTGKAGRVYDLVSSTDLSTAIGTWPVWDGKQGLYGTPPNNALANIPGGGDERRFFALAERIAPPLLSESFDAAAQLPVGWTSNGPVNGTDWEVGVPSGVNSGPASAFTVPNCAGTNIGGYYTENSDVSLKSPVLAIPAGNGATLRFRQFIDTDGLADFGAVRVLDADNADTPIAGLALSGLQGVGGVWTQNTLEMSELDVGGKNIRIEFGFVSNVGNIQDVEVYSGFYVDEVFVTLD